MRQLFMAIFLFILEVGTQSKAQTPPASGRAPDPPPLRAPATPVQSNAPSVFELLRTRYRFENDGTGRKEVIGKIRILNAMGVLQQAEETFEYRPLSEELQILYIRVRKKDGTVVNVDPNVAQKPPNGVNPEHDINERRVRIPGLSVGDLVEYNVAIVLHVPLGPSEFYVAHSFQPGTLDEQLEVDVPRDRAVKVKGIPTLRTWTTADARRKVYHWENQKTKPRQVRVVHYVTDRTPDVQVSSFLGWEEVGRWYEALERSQRAVTPEVEAKADELTKGLNSDSERVEALYDFVARKIKYTNLPLNVAGFVPHSASETLYNQHGDCKDKVALLTALLEASDLHPSLALTSPEREPDPEIPSPWPFTHVIAMLRLGKEEFWMDPSPPGLPFRMLIPSLRGREALVIPRNGVPRFQKTPTEAPVPNTWIEEVHGKMGNNGALEATVHISARGDVELLLRQAFISSFESAWPIAVQEIVKGIDRRTDKVSDIKISDPTATNEPFTLSFRISRLHFSDFSRGVAKFQLPLADFDLPSAVENGITDRNGGWHRIKSEPVLLGPPGKRVFSLALELPPGFYPHLPESAVLQCSGGTYRAAYKWDGTSLTVERDLIFRKEQLPAHLREEYSAFRTKVVEDIEQIVEASTAGA
jgi:hypothetical protein